MNQYFEGLRTIALTVTDRDNRILDMNQRSAEVNNHGSKDIVGNDLMACHPPMAQQVIRRIISTQTPNVYTIEKTQADGSKMKKLIYQTPWYEADGSYGGLVELSLEIPFDMPHYVRQPKPQQ